MLHTVYRNPKLLLIVAVALSSVCIYAVIAVFHSLLPFQYIIYLTDAHHFLVDPRIAGYPFDFLRALGQFDAQWYLRIAATGYPYHPIVTDMDDRTVMDGLTYAFFPLYPIIIAVLNTVIGKPELSAFIVSNVLIIVDALSLYHLVNGIYNTPIAVRTVLLLFAFPFSIFFRSYFAEGLQLFFIIWFCYFLLRNKYLFAASALALLNVTKGTSMLLNVLFIVYLGMHYAKHKITIRQIAMSLFIVAIPLSTWIIYNGIQTGNPLYFYAIQQSWDATPFYIHPVHNIETMLNLFRLPFNGFHYSFIHTLVAIYVFIFLMMSIKSLPPLIWWIGFLIWLTPFLSIDFTSFSRYQSVSFPLFIFLAQLFSSNKVFIPVLVISFALLILVSLYFVNWYWIG